MIEAEKKPLDIREIVDNAIRAIAEKLSETKGTIGDLIRLLQLRDELAVQPKGMVLAGWVSECDKTLRDQ